MKSGSIITTCCNSNSTADFPVQPAMLTFNFNDTSMDFRYAKPLMIFFFCWAVLCTECLAQAGTGRAQWKQLSAKLLQQKGLWIIPGQKNTAVVATYRYMATATDDSLLLKIHRTPKPNLTENYIQQLVFTWNEKAGNVQVSGKDVLGNIYQGESGKITASEISFDLLDPTIVSTPSFLRFNQSVTGNSSSISFYKQDADKWVFIKQENLALAGR